jgi:predicted Zn-dependent protease
MTDSHRTDDLRRRVQSDPASIAFAALAEEYRRDGRFDDAIATCTAGLKRHPSYLSARVTLGRALLGAGRYDDARAELNLVLRAAPENLAAIRTLAEIEARLNPVVAPTEALPPAAAASPPSNDPTSPANTRIRALESFLDAVHRARTIPAGFGS